MGFKISEKGDIRWLGMYNEEKLTLHLSQQQSEEAIQGTQRF